VVQLDGIVEVLELEADEALLPVPASSRRVARRAVPGRRGDHLGVLDRPVADLHPVAQAAARGADQSVAITVALGFSGRVRRLAEVCAELVQRLAHRLEHPHGAVEPRELPQPRVRSLRIKE
jgi:hypothetical protein